MLVEQQVQWWVGEAYIHIFSNNTVYENDEMHEFVAITLVGYFLINSTQASIQLGFA